MTIRLRAVLAATLALFLALAAPALAQESMPAQALGQQSLRAYWHVFIAYALVLVLVLGYVVSIARRLAHVERKLEE